MSTVLADQLCAAAIPFMGTVLEARELANNITCWIAPMPELEAHIAMSIRHRLANGFATCGDVDSCAVAIARTFRRHHASKQWDGSVEGGRVAVGRKGPAFGTSEFQILTGRA
jgi:hypothetical protein